MEKEPFEIGDIVYVKIDQTNRSSPSTVRHHLKIGAIVTVVSLNPRDRCIVQALDATAFHSPFVGWSNDRGDHLQQISYSDLERITARPKAIRAQSLAILPHI